MRGFEIRAFASNVKVVVAVVVLSSFGCNRDGDRTSTNLEPVRTRAEAAIRSSRAFDGNLICETRVGGRALLTFRDNSSARGTQALDLDPFPMVVVDTARMTARVLERRRLGGIDRAPAANGIFSPIGVDSSGAATIAAQLVPRTSTLHCVIATERAYFVETIESDRSLKAEVRGLMVIVPRGGVAHVTGTFEESRQP